MKSGRHLLAEPVLGELLTGLSQDWQINPERSAISRLVKVSDFDEALSLVKQCAALAAEQNHHPDIRFGWGYCEITYTSHDVGGLTHRDIDSASALDAIISNSLPSGANT